MPRFPTIRAGVTRLLFWFGVALLVGSLSGRSLAFDGEKYLPQAKVSLAQARQIALKTYPGKILSEELEKESGGSGLRYSLVIIGSNNEKHEVGVDAKTGAVLENSVEGNNPD